MKVINIFSRTIDISFLWLITGMVLLFFTRANTQVPITIFFAPIFFIRYMKTNSVLKGTASIITAFVITCLLAMWGLFPLGDEKNTLIFNSVRNTAIGLTLVQPYIINRVLSRYYKGFFSTLIFPVCCVSIYYINNLVNPIASTGVFSSYAQHGNMPLMQGLSLAGLWGMVFAISWASSFVEHIWENTDFVKENKKGTTFFVIIFCFFQLYGGLRISPFFFPSGKSVRIASATFSDNSHHNETILEVGKILKDKIPSDYEKTMKEINRISENAANSGAKIIVFQEYAIFIKNISETRLISDCREISSRLGIFLCLDYGVFNEKGPGENKCLLINDKGLLECVYVKRNLFMGEDTYMKGGTGEIPIVSTHFGRIGISICRDMENPYYIRQASLKGIDIMLSPAIDFPRKVTPVNSYNYGFRGIENGFSTVRCVKDGLSLATDYHGRTISAQYDFTSESVTMFADVPIRGAWTLYKLIGDAIAYISILALSAIIAVLMKKNVIFRVKKYD